MSASKKKHARVEKEVAQVREMNEQKNLTDARVHAHALRHLGTPELVAPAVQGLKAVMAKPDSPKVPQEHVDTFCDGYFKQVAKDQREEAAAAKPAASPYKWK